MAKKVVGKIKLQIEAGKANPSPPVGPALGQHGVNIMDFCKQFNAKTESQAGYIIPVVIDVYVLMLLHRCELAVKMSRSCVFLPYPFVLEPFKVRASKHLVKRQLREQHNRPAMPYHAPVLLPHLVKRNDGIPLRLRRSVWRVAQNQINRMVGDSRHHFKAVSMI